MNSKERVRMAIEHREPDRVPLDYYSRPEITKKCMDTLGTETEEELLQKLGIDQRRIAPVFKGEEAPLRYADPTVSVTEEGIYKDIWGVGFSANDTGSGFYMDLAENPLSGITSAVELDKHTWPDPDMWDYSSAAAQAESHSDYWVWTHSRGIFEISWFLRGFDNFMVDLMVNPELANALMDRAQDYLFEKARRILETADGSIDMMEYNDDIGSQEGILINPDTWRIMLKPRMAVFIDMCKQFGVKVRYHSCGGYTEIIPDLIEIGLDVLNPVQTRAKGMDPQTLAREFGDQLTFSGGIDTQELLPFASPEEVKAEARMLIDVLGKDGGFILGPSHKFQADVPVENVLAMYEAGGAAMPRQ
ncbi:uroporphyrinogen decarboxylase family protein [Planctomycetota bacterium]